ncbi:MAG TPA: YqgE/AlgH family protein [Burkholderiales bacterium]
MKAFLLVLAAALPWALPAAAADLSESVLLVAKRQLRDKMYGATILVARPIGNDQHIGFIVNRPTKVTLGQLFPQHPPSQKVPDPVYVGGPISAESIFALVQTRKHPGGRSVQLMPGMFAVFDGKIVDDVIEHEAGKARFVAGLVGWRAGELRDEVKRGAWFVLDADPKVVLRKPEGLWEELVRRAEQRANSI